MPPKTPSEPIDAAGPGWTPERQKYLKRELKISDAQLEALMEELPVPVKMPGRKAPPKKDIVDEAKKLVGALRKAERQVSRLVDAEAAITASWTQIPAIPYVEADIDKNVDLPEDVQGALPKFHGDPRHDAVSLVLAREMRSSSDPWPDETERDAPVENDGIDLSVLLESITRAHEKAAQVQAKIKAREHGS